MTDNYGRMNERDLAIAVEEVIEALGNRAFQAEAKLRDMELRVEALESDVGRWKAAEKRYPKGEAE